MISDIIEIKAKLTLYSTENGGRQSGIKTGYRPNHIFEYKESDEITCLFYEIKFEQKSTPTIIY